MKLLNHFPLRSTLFPAAVCLVSLYPLGADAEIIHVSTPGTSLVLDGEKGGSLDFLYYGAALSPSEIGQLKNSGFKPLSAFPFYGNYPEHESAMAATHADGNMTLDMAVEDISRSSSDGAEITTVTMRDKAYPLTVKLNYKTYPGEDVIETWTETINGENKPVTLTQFSSGYLPIRYGDVWL
ncbi:MAG: alpha-galactosidase, partial [Muribaculaceae bacterium]|nr:alpha-galactosidase [Muribaculaceae bacterium]